MNNDLPTVFVFTKNGIPAFYVSKEDVAWQTTTSNNVMV